MSELHTDSFHSIQAMLDSYKCRELEPAGPPTLLEIAGFPHWENVCSNILAFFLDTGQAHGFGPLFVRSILGAYRSRCRQDWLEGVPCPENVGAADAVKREDITDNGKRIDILVDCADFRICIENKIRADLNNDLGDYREHCKKDSDGRPVLGIVLSPDHIQSDELNANRFVSITYDDLVKQVSQRLDYIGSEFTRYRYLLCDFLEHAGRFSRTTKMNDDDKAFLEFWKQNELKMSNIDKWRERMRELLHGKAEAHQKKCLSRLSEREQEVFKSWTHKKNTAVFDLKENGAIDGCSIYLDVEFHPLRVTHILGKRRGSDPTALVTKIKECCPTLSFKTSIGSNRHKFAIEDTPFNENDSVCDQAVQTSVDILKYIAERYLAEKD